MIQKDFLKEIIRQQEINLHAKEEGMIRDSLCTLPDIDNYALIVSGGVFLVKEIGEFLFL
mgnify:CR=1 FL=1